MSPRMLFPLDWNRAASPSLLTTSLEPSAPDSRRANDAIPVPIPVAVPFSPPPKMMEIDFLRTHAFQCHAIVRNGSRCQEITGLTQQTWNPPCKKCGLRPKAGNYSVKYVPMPGPMVQQTINGDWVSSSKVVYRWSFDEELQREDTQEKIIEEVLRKD